MYPDFKNDVYRASQRRFFLNSQETEFFNSHSRLHNGAKPGIQRPLAHEMAMFRQHTSE